MTTDLYALANSVFDEIGFLRFLEALAIDWENEQLLEKPNPLPTYSSGPRGWENNTIGSALGAAAAWGMASVSGLSHDEIKKNPWQRAAHIIYAAKFYE